MSLKKRLFLWVGALFFFSFVIITVFEIFWTERHLKLAENNLRQEILALSKESRDQVQHVLQTSLQSLQAKIDALLLHISSYRQIESHFSSPSSWKASTRLLLREEWVDYLENRYENEISSLIIPRQGDQRFEVIKEIDKDLLVFIDENEQQYIGIELSPPEESTFYDSLTSHSTRLFFLFSKEQVEELSSEDVSFADRIKQAIPAFLKESSFTLAESSEETFVEELVWKSDKRVMMALLPRITSLLFDTSDPLAPSSPKGMVRLLQGEREGKGFLTREVFFRHSTSDEILPTSSKEHIQVISLPEKQEIFFARTLTIDREANLTLGVNGKRLLRMVSEMTQRAAFLLYEGKEIASVAALAKHQELLQEKLPFSEMIDKEIGEISVDGKDLFYLHVQPYPDLNLHLYLISPTSSEFGLIRDLEGAAKRLVQSISVSTWSVALITIAIAFMLLSRIVGKVTSPITRLAKATDAVARGNYSEIELPQRIRENDEVSELYHNFTEMVDGLKKKEQVEGVLNKVVSPEIAEQILKSDLHLGGKEAKVTILFADIRQFTQISEKMPAEEVTQMLNTCMTKLAGEVDRFGGVIDKYVGDEMMALFGIPEHRDESTKKAIECAIAIQNALEEWNNEREKKGEQKIEMGIGIHTGNVIAGNMGAESRLNFTVIGREVNLAARLCSGAERGEILLTEATVKEPGIEVFHAEKLEPRQFKGFSEPIPIFRVRNFTKSS